MIVNVVMYYLELIVSCLKAWTYGFFSQVSGLEGSLSPATQGAEAWAS
jgi:hypothetical protein